MLVAIDVPALGPNERGTFLKLGLRQAQAISLVNVAVIVDLEPGASENAPRVRRARIALGSVAPTIMRAGEAEGYLAGKALAEEHVQQAAGLAAAAIRPITDVRASAEYRRHMAQVLTVRALRQIRDGTERAGWPGRPVLLQGAAHAGNGRAKQAGAAPDGEHRVHA